MLVFCIFVCLIAVFTSSTAGDANFILKHFECRNRVQLEGGRSVGPGLGLTAVETGSGLPWYVDTNDTLKTVDKDLCVQQAPDDKLRLGECGGGRNWRIVCVDNCSFDDSSKWYAIMDGNGRVAVWGDRPYVWNGDPSVTNELNNNAEKNYLYGKNNDQFKNDFGSMWSKVPMT